MSNPSTGDPGCFGYFGLFAISSGGMFSKGFILRERRGEREKGKDKENMQCNNFEDTISTTISNNKILHSDEIPNYYQNFLEIFISFVVTYFISWLFL